MSALTEWLNQKKRQAQAQPFRTQRSFAVDPVKDRFLGNTGNGPDGVLQPNRPTHAVPMQGGTALLDEGEDVFRKPNGDLQVMPANQSMGGPVLPAVQSQEDLMNLKNAEQTQSFACGGRVKSYKCGGRIKSYQTGGTVVGDPRFGGATAKQLEMAGISIPEQQDRVIGDTAQTATLPAINVQPTTTIGTGPGGATQKQLEMAGIAPTTTVGSPALGGATAKQLEMAGITDTQVSPTTTIGSPEIGGATQKQLEMANIVQPPPPPAPAPSTVVGSPQVGGATPEQLSRAGVTVGTPETGGATPAQLEMAAPAPAPTPPTTVGDPMFGGATPEQLSRAGIDPATTTIGLPQFGGATQAQLEQAGILGTGPGGATPAQLEQAGEISTQVLPPVTEAPTVPEEAAPTTPETTQADRFANQALGRLAQLMAGGSPADRAESQRMLDQLAAQFGQEQAVNAALMVRQGVDPAVAASRLAQSAAVGRQVVAGAAADVEAQRMRTAETAAQTLATQAADAQRLEDTRQRYGDQQFQRMAYDISRGMSFADAQAKYPGLTNDEYQRIARGFERGEELGEVQLDSAKVAVDAQKFGLSSQQMDAVIRAANSGASAAFINSQFGTNISQADVDDLAERYRQDLAIGDIGIQSARLGLTTQELQNQALDAGLTTTQYSQVVDMVGAGFSTARINQDLGTNLTDAEVANIYQNTPAGQRDMDFKLNMVSAKIDAGDFDGANTDITSLGGTPIDFSKIKSEEDKAAWNTAYSSALGHIQSGTDSVSAMNAMKNEGTFEDLGISDDEFPQWYDNMAWSTSQVGQLFTGTFNDRVLTEVYGLTDKTQMFNFRRDMAKLSVSGDITVNEDGTISIDSESAQRVLENYDFGDTGAITKTTGDTGVTGAVTVGGTTVGVSGASTPFDTTDDSIAIQNPDGTFTEFKVDSEDPFSDANKNILDFQKSFIAEHGESPEDPATKQRLDVINSMANDIINSRVDSYIDGTAPIPNEGLARDSAEYQEIINRTTGVIEGTGGRKDTGAGKPMVFEKMEGRTTGDLVKFGDSVYSLSDDYRKVVDIKGSDDQVVYTMIGVDDGKQYAVMSGPMDEGTFDKPVLAKDSDHDAWVEEMRSYKNGQITWDALVGNNQWFFATGGYGEGLTEEQFNKDVVMNDKGGLNISGKAGKPTTVRRDLPSSTRS